MALSESTFRDRPRRGMRVASILTATAVSLLAFQNFSPLSLDQMKPTLTPAAARVSEGDHVDVDIRKLAPQKPSGYETPAFAAPQVGTDLDSVSRDWMMRQTNLLTGGIEQQMVSKLNEKMTRMMKFEEIEGEPWPEPDDSTGSGDSKQGDEDQSPSFPILPSDGPTAEEDPGSDSSAIWRPRSVRFVSLNRLQMGLTEKSSLTCSFEGASIAVDLSTPLTSSSGVSFHHESGTSKSSFRFNYSW